MTSSFKNTEHLAKTEKKNYKSHGLKKDAINVKPNHFLNHLHFKPAGKIFTQKSGKEEFHLRDQLCLMKVKKDWKRAIVENYNEEIPDLAKKKSKKKVLMTKKVLIKNGREANMGPKAGSNLHDKYIKELTLMGWFLSSNQNRIVLNKNKIKLELY